MKQIILGSNVKIIVVWKFLPFYFKKSGLNSQTDVTMSKIHSSNFRRYITQNKNKQPHPKKDIESFLSDTNL